MSIHQIFFNVCKDESLLNSSDLSEVDFKHNFYLSGMLSFCAFWTLCTKVYIPYTHIDGRWGDGTKNGRIGCLVGWLVRRATILRICPSLDNALPPLGTQSSNRVWSVIKHTDWPLDGNTNLVAKLWTRRGKGNTVEQRLT